MQRAWFFSLTQPGAVGTNKAEISDALSAFIKQSVGSGDILYLRHLTGFIWPETGPEICHMGRCAIVTEDQGYYLAYAFTTKLTLLRSPINRIQGRA